MFWLYGSACDVHLRLICLSRLPRAVFRSFSYWLPRCLVFFLEHCCSVVFDAGVRGLLRQLDWTVIDKGDRLGLLVQKWNW